jgi:hypothetical protein
MRRLCILLAVSQFAVIQAFAGVDVFAELGRPAPGKKKPVTKRPRMHPQVMLPQRVVAKKKS